MNGTRVTIWNFMTTLKRAEMLSVSRDDSLLQWLHSL